MTSAMTRVIYHAEPYHDAFDASAIRYSVEVKVDQSDGSNPRHQVERFDSQLEAMAFAIAALTEANDRARIV